MADRPIIFSGPMVRALLEGRKTQTRRVLKPLSRRTIFFDPKTAGLDQFQEPPYAPGDRLWVREAWSARMTHGWTIADARSGHYQTELLYRADGEDGVEGWWPSIHMPREFSRLTLTVADVRVQRLQSICEADAVAEGGIPADHPIDVGCWNHDGGIVLHPSARDSFHDLWNSLHGPDAWGQNPWVAAITFSVHRCNIDKMRKDAP